MQHHQPLRQPLRPRRPHMIGREHVEHRGPCHPRDRADEGAAEGECGQDDRPQPIRGPERPAAAGEGQPLPLEADEPDQHQPEEEDRHRDAGDADRHDRPVQQRPAPIGRERAHPDAERDGPDEARRHQLQRRPDRRAKLLRDRDVVDDGDAEITLRQPPEIQTELHMQRLVQPEVAADGGDHLRRRGRAGADGRRIGRHHLHQQEADQQHPEQDRDGEQQPVHGVAQHQPSDGRSVTGSSPIVKDPAAPGARCRAAAAAG